MADERYNNNNGRGDWLTVIISIIFALIGASFAYTELRISRVEERIESFVSWVYQNMYGPRR